MRSADEIIETLALVPHPEGGYFRETFRDAQSVNGRAASTAAYYLLKAGQRSHWHRVDAAEVWHFYAGAPLVLSIKTPAGVSVHRLGIDLLAGEAPQVIVPADMWQSAESAGAWTLVGVTVAPGFEFGGFEMAPEGWRP
ncbi:MAG: cupin domain-containing protein [Methylovirgula sp.]|nr:cupin domain-containing protein [Methylovirgula sp.]